MTGYLCDVYGEPYNAETFSIEEYFGQFDPEWLSSPAGRRELTRDDPALFAALYVPHLLKNAEGEITFSDVHLGLYREALALRELPMPGGDRRAYVAPRGSGKSSTLFVITTLWVACHHPTFVAAFSSSSTQAVDHLHTVRKELQRNTLLREDYEAACLPELKANGNPVADNDAMLLTRNGFAFSARGVDTEVLGLVDPLNRRPGIIYLDDIEGAEGSGYSKYQAGQRMKTITDGILPMNDRAHVRLIGTVTIPGGLVHQLVRYAVEGAESEQWIADERFKVTYFPPIISREDGTPRSTWPGKWPIEYLLSIQGTRSFKKNFANLPVAEDGDYWTDEDFRYGTLGDLATRWILQIDPAVTTKGSSDWTGLAVIACRPPAVVRRVPGMDPAVALRLAAEQAHRDGLPEWMDPFEAQCEVVEAKQVKLAGEKLRAEVLRTLTRHPKIHGVRIETNAGGETWRTILHDLPPGVRLVEHSSSVSKEARFAAALTRWHERRVIHRERIVVLEDQMTGFPRMPHDDVADAATLAVLFFLQPRAGKKQARATVSSYR